MLIGLHWFIRRRTFWVQRIGQRRELLNQVLLFNLVHVWSVQLGQLKHANSPILSTMLGWFFTLARRPRGFWRPQLLLGLAQALRLALAPSLLVPRAHPLLVGVGLPRCSPILKSNSWYIFVSIRYTPQRFLRYWWLTQLSAHSSWAYAAPRARRGSWARTPLHFFKNYFSR